VKRHVTLPPDRRAGLAVSRLLAIAVFLSAVVPASAAAQWTQGQPGKVWVKSALYLQKTDRRFDFNGEKVAWLGDGQSDAVALFNDIIIGLRPNLDLWFQIPYFDLEFDQPGVQNLQSRGFGDIRAWLRWRLLNPGGGATPVSLRVGAKAPIGDSPLDAQIVPLGEGQWDFEAFGEIGHSFWPFPAYAELWLGYRARLENTESTRDPGGEFTYLAEAGVQPTSWSLLKTTVDGLFARRLRSEGVVTANARRITTIQFGGAIRAGPFWPEFAVRIPVAGEEFPAGVQYVFGFSSQVR
jgi:hypothetical protein